MTRALSSLLCVLALTACRAAPCPSVPAALATTASPAAPPVAPTPPVTAERISELPKLPELPRLTGKQVLRDLRIAERALTDLHPGIDRYLTRQGLAAQLATLRAELAEGTDLGGMMLAISRLTAAVRCGHTWTNTLNQPARVRQALEDRADKLPVYLRLVEGRLLVTASAAPEIAAGSELLAIDERTPSDLVRELWPYLRADGSSDGKRLSQLDHDDGGALDRLLPLLHPPVQGRYRLRLRGPSGEPGERTVRALTSAERTATLTAAGWREPSEAWTFEITGDTAILTLPTFAFWNGTFDWRGFLERSFAELEQRAVPYLVIDQRRNEGGDGNIVYALLSRLISAPYRQEAGRAEVAYERVPYDLARFLDTWDYSFFDRTGKVAKKQPGRNFHYITTSSKGNVVRPAPRPYRGRTFALIGPANSSAGFVLAAVLKRSGAATLVGQATGGNQRGLNGGELTWITLPESGISFDIPLVAWMPPGAPPDAGIAPDLAVSPSFAQAAAGVDAELSFTLAEIAKLRAATIR